MYPFLSTIFKQRKVYPDYQDDRDKRLQFCKEMNQRLNEDLELCNICFSDEGTFCENGSGMTAAHSYFVGFKPNILK